MHVRWKFHTRNGINYVVKGFCPLNLSLRIRIGIKLSVGENWWRSGVFLKRELMTCWVPFIPANLSGLGQIRIRAVRWIVHWLSVTASWIVIVLVVAVVVIVVTVIITIIVGIWWSAQLAEFRCHVLVPKESWKLNRALEKLMNKWITSSSKDFESIARIPAGIGTELHRRQQLQHLQAVVREQNMKPRHRKINSIIPIKQINHWVKTLERVLLDQNLQHVNLCCWNC